MTGHSLGGAMAVLFALTLSGNSVHRSIANRLRAVYTFGQPMTVAGPLPHATDAIHGSCFVMSPRTIQSRRFPRRRGDRSSISDRSIALLMVNGSAPVPRRPVGEHAGDPTRGSGFLRERKAARVVPVYARGSRAAPLYRRPSARQSCYGVRRLTSNHPPAEPEAFRLLAPQRGLIATGKTARARSSVSAR